MATARPTIMLRKTANGPVPASAYDAELWDAVPLNADVEAKHVTRRSNPQNKLYWAVLSNMTANTWLGDKWPSPRKLHKALLREVGMVDVSFDFDGSVRLVEDSTAFDKMDAADFRIYFDKAMARLAELIGADPLASSEGKAA